MKASDSDPGAEVRAWDLPTRLFHWSLVTLILVSYLTRTFSKDPTLYWHRASGYAVLSLIVFRLLWGFVGSSTARFGSFLRWPWHALTYGLDLVRRRPRHFLGHNPAGSWIILGLLVLVSAQALSGLATTDDVIAEGPLVSHVSDAVVSKASAYHAWGFWNLLALVAVHILANVIYQVWKKDRLITSMVTGRKPALAYEDERQVRLAPTWLACLCLAVAIGLVVGGVMLAGGSVLR